MKKINELSAKDKKQLKTLSEFIKIFCREKHPALKKETPFYQKKYNLNELFKIRGFSLCSDCQTLILYATARFLACPYNPKPQCKNCATHCYQGNYREQIKEVMKFSGRYLLKRGRLDLLAHYLS